MTPLDYHFKIKAKVTNRRPLDYHFKIKAKVTNRRPLDYHFKINAKIARTTYNQLNHFKIKAKIRKVGFLDTMFTIPSYGSSPVIPSPYEIDEIMAVRTYIQLPDSGIEKLIAYSRPEEIGFNWQLNKELLWNLTLIDFDRDLVRPWSEFYGLLDEGFYNRNWGRKFIKIVLRSWCKDKYVDFTLPRLVIKETPKSGYKISLSGYDYITEILTQEINLQSFCAMEALGRIDNRNFISTSLTNNYITELFVNYQLATTGWSYNQTNRIVTFAFDIPENYVVFARSPISKEKAIRSICDQSVNKLPSAITKEYINCIFRIQDKPFDAELATFGVRPRDTICKLSNSVPADSLILPRGNNLDLVFMNKVLGDEYSSPKFHLPETLMYGGRIQMPKSSVKAFTYGHVIRYSRVYDAQQAITVTQ